MEPYLGIISKSVMIREWFLPFQRMAVVILSSRGWMNAMVIMTSTLNDTQAKEQHWEVISKSMMI